MKKSVASKKYTKSLKVLFLLTMLGTVSTSSANGFFGNNNNGFGRFFGGNNSCNNWPIWTPMYWMEEMSGSRLGNGFGGNNRFGNRNNNCNNGYYGGGSYNPYPSPYNVNPYLSSPYGQQAYVYRPPAYSTFNRFPQSSYGSSLGIPPFMGNGFSGFPNFSGTPGSPFSSFGGGSPFSRFGSPMGMGGFGSPMSPMSPMSMGTMGMPGMSPMSGFGGSPFGGSSFMPFR